MASKRAKLFSTKNFGLIIGLLVVGIFILLDMGTAITDRLETKMLDVHFNLKTLYRPESTQEGTQVIQRNPNISPDILVLGIDSPTLSRLGRWPFPRSRHADLINSFSRISNPDAREQSLFLDLFFIEPSDDAVNDALLIDAITRSDTVFLETILDFSEPPSRDAADLFARHQRLFQAAGKLTNITGTWKTMPSFFGLQPPLQPIGAVVSGYGHANLFDDFDKVYRRQPMVARVSELLGEYLIEEITPALEIDESAFQRLVWFDTRGRDHNIDLPLTDEILTELQARLESDAPPIAIDTDDDGEPDTNSYLIRHYQEQFIPSITLALASDYLNVPLENLEVVVGSHVRIPDPQMFDTETGQWGPYRVLAVAAEMNEENEVVTPAVYDEPSEIVIPIDEYGMMLINFMGPRSSSARDGYQTFPVRPYYGYAARATSPDPTSWPPTLGVENKIIMVGAFAQGMADDEKLTPYGLMYGVEVHANALNTILMDRFIHYVPSWIDYTILAVVTIVIAFMSSRLSTIWSFAVSMVFIVVFFFVVTSVFDTRAIVINFSTPALSVIFTFVSIVVYRVVTEERDKQRIRDMFGKYVSPAVVEEILDSPPELGGVDKDLTVFFSDIRGFTTLSEAMTPQELVNHLNVYLTAMTDIILEYRGTLDKYVGDEIMCFWGAPVPQADHAILACKSALRQMQALHELNESWPPERRINIGIGLNSGIMTVGNMGSMGRMNYTLMGDNVNLGARLEGTNKQYTTNIIMSEFTYGLVRDRVIARELDNIRVKGKNKPVVIYELVDVPEGLEA